MARKILVVEDNAAFRYLLVTILSSISSRIIEAANGQEAIEKAFAEVPDIIIMDIALPEISGIEATVRIKANPKTAQIPVIAYTVWGDLFKEKALEVGIAEYLNKGTSPQVLREVVEKFLQAKS